MQSAELIDFHSCAFSLQEAEAVVCVATHLLSSVNIIWFMAVYVGSDLMLVVSCSMLPTGTAPKSESCTYAAS